MKWNSRSLLSPFLVGLSLAALGFAEDEPAGSSAPPVAAASPAEPNLLLRIDVTARDEPIQKVLRRIAAGYKLRVAFDQNAVRQAGRRLDEPVTVTLRNFTLGQTLDRLLRGLGLQHALSGDVLTITVRAPSPPDRLADRQEVVFFEPMDEQPGAARRVADRTFDAWVFDDRVTPASLRVRFDRLLHRRTDMLAERCGLSAVQTKKLQLAGRGDIERFFERLTQLRRDFLVIKDDDRKRTEFFTRQIRPLQKELNAGPFGAGSLLSKAIPTTLTPVQLDLHLPQQVPGYGSVSIIGLALLGYHDCFGHFPSAIQHGPDGKTTYSWRVELLPLLRHYVERRPGNEELFSGQLSGDALRKAWWKSIEDLGYRLDEPWDGARNRAWLRQAANDYAHPDQGVGSVNSAFFAVVGPETVIRPDMGMKLDAIGDKPGSTLIIVEALRDIPWTMPDDLPFEAGHALPKFGGFGKNVFLSLTCDGAVHSIALGTGDPSLQALITPNAGDEAAIPGVPWRPESDPTSATPAAEMPTSQPDRISVGTLHVGAIAEASVRILVRGDDVRKIDGQTDPPPFMKVTQTRLGTQVYGNRGTFIYCDVHVAFDTSRAGEFHGPLRVRFGPHDVEVPVEARVLPPQAGQTRLLVVQSPFSRFSTSDASLFDPWRDLVKSANLSASYLEAHADQPVLRDLDLSRFDVVLLGEGGIFAAQNGDFEKLKKFVETGGRVVVAANHFMRGTVEKANQFVVPYGLRMVDEEPRGVNIVEIGEGEIAASPLTRNVRSLRFFRASPTIVTDEAKAELLVEAPPFPKGGFVAVARSGRGEVVTLGASLWWNWITSEQEAGADNAALLKNLLNKPKP